MDKPKLYRLDFPVNLCRWLSLSHQNIVDVCRVSKSTARRYLKTGSAPYAIYKLLDLHVRGKILPDSWSYTYISLTGRLVVNGMGELTENQIVNLHNQKEQHYWQVAGLKKETRRVKSDLEKAEQRIARLEAHLDEANSKLGLRKAANDEVWSRK